jgi:hypothetical protein
MREENRNKFSDKKNKSIFIFHHKIVELIKQKMIYFMMKVVDLVVMVVVMIVHTFDKMVDTSVVVDMTFDYKIHYKD